MTHAYQWFTAHWGTISIVLFTLINLLNAATVHFSEHKGIAKWLLFIVEQLSIIRSAGSEVGPLGNLKAPLKIFAKDPPKLPFFLLFVSGLGLALSACAQTVSTVCQRSLIALEAIDQIALATINKTCLAEATKCGRVTGEKCPGWVACDKQRAEYKAIMDSTGKGITEINRLSSKFGISAEKVK